MLIFGLRSTFDFQLGWLMDSNPICPIQYMEIWILSELQLFQSFPTEVAWNGQFHPICIRLFQSFPTEEAQNDSEQPILPDLQLFHQSGSDNETVYTAPSPMEWHNGNSVFQIPVGTWSSTCMMIFTSCQSRLLVMEIVTLQLNLTNYTYLYTLDHNFVTIHPI